MHKTESGNIYTKKNGDRGWIMGHFEQLSGTPFQNNDFEIKWTQHTKGEKKEGAKANRTAKTVSILVRGKMKIDFLEPRETYLLKAEGDYTFWQAGVTHSWEILEDSLVITIRWPSLKDDQL